MNENLQWSLKLDYSNLDTGAKKASSAFKSIFKEAGNAKNGLSQVDTQFKKTAKVATSSGNIMRKAFAGVATALSIGALVKFTQSSIELGSALTEVQNVVDVVFGEGNKTIEDFAKNSMTSFGLSELSAKRYTGTMGAMLKSMNLTAKEAEGMSIEMVKLAGDMASFYDSNVDEAFNKIRAGISGETEPLKQWGINMNIVNLNAYAVAQGLGKTYDQMTLNEQAMLRYNYLLSVTGDAQGDFARNSNTWANQMRILKLQWESFKSSMGQAFIAVLTPVLRWLNTLMATLIKVAQAFAIFVKTLFGIETEVASVGSAVSSVADATGGISSGFDDATSSAKKTAKAMKQLTQLGIDVLNVVKPADSGSDDAGSGSGGGSVGGVGGGMGDIGSLTPDIDTSGITKATQLAEGFRKKWAEIKDLIIKNKVPIVSTLSAIGAGFATFGIVKMLPSLVTFFNTISGGVGLFKLWTGEMGLLKGTFDLIATSIGTTSLTIAGIIIVVMAVVGAIAQLWQTNEGFRASIIEAWTGIKDTFVKYWDNFLKPVFDSFVEMLKNIWDYGIKPLWDGWVEFVRSIVMAMTELWNDVLKPVVDWIITTFGPIFAQIFDAVSKVVSFAMATVGQVIGTAFKNIATYVDGIVGVFKGIITFLTGVFTGDWSKAWEGVKQIFSSIVGTFKGIFQNVWNMIIGIFNTGGKIFDGIVDGIVGIFKTVVNGLIGGINKVVAIPFNTINGLLNGIRDLSFLGVAPFKGMWGYNPLPVPQIPKFADGNIAYGPVVAQFGEYEGASRDPEVTTPLSKLKKMLPDSTSPEMLAELREQNRLLKELNAKDSNVYMDADKVGGTIDKKKARKARQKGLAPAN